MCKPSHLFQNSLVPSATKRAYHLPGERMSAVSYNKEGTYLAAINRRNAVVLDPAGRVHAAFQPNASWAVTELAWLGNSTLLYSNLESELYLVHVPQERSTKALKQERLLLGVEGQERDWWRFFSFAVAPGDGEICIATSDGELCIYSLETKKLVEKFPAHKNDINSVCYLAGEGAASDVICSGSDDGLVQLSDRRCPRKCAGVLAGHSAGVTSVSSRGDGIHLCSNGKDQSVKIFDIRRALSAVAWGEEGPHPRSPQGTPAALQENPLPYAFDYRMQIPTPKIFIDRHQRDVSVSTLRGGTVLRTLIRSQWSPLDTTGGRYIASGSYDGGVCIWDLFQGGGGSLLPHTVLHPHGSSLVRAVAWSPDGLELATCGWEDGCLAVSAFEEGQRSGLRQAHLRTLRGHMAYFDSASGRRYRAVLGPIIDKAALRFKKLEEKEGGSGEGGAGEGEVGHDAEADVDNDADENFWDDDDEEEEEEEELEEDDDEEEE